MIAESAMADPGAEARLLDCSRRASLAELRLECARVNAAAGPDPEQRRARTHITTLDLLDQLCTHHHHLKTNDGWALTAGHGKRPLVPPDDPRHPGPSP